MAPDSRSLLLASPAGYRRPAPWPKAIGYPFGGQRRVNLVGRPTPSGDKLGQERWHEQRFPRAHFPGPSWRGGCRDATTLNATSNGTGSHHKPPAALTTTTWTEGRDRRLPRHRGGDLRMVEKVYGPLPVEMLGARLRSIVEPNADQDSPTRERGIRAG